MFCYGRPLNGEERKPVYENAGNEAASVTGDQEYPDPLYSPVSGVEIAPGNSQQTYGNPADYEIPIQTKGVTGMSYVRVFAGTV